MTRRRGTARRRLRTGTTTLAAGRSVGKTEGARDRRGPPGRGGPSHSPAFGAPGSTAPPAGPGSTAAPAARTDPLARATQLGIVVEEEPGLVLPLRTRERRPAPQDSRQERLGEEEGPHLASRSARTPSAECFVIRRTWARSSMSRGSQSAKDPASAARASASTTRTRSHRRMGLTRTRPARLSGMRGDRRTSSRKRHPLGAAGAGGGPRAAKTNVRGWHPRIDSQRPIRQELSKVYRRSIEGYRRLSKGYRGSIEGYRGSIEGYRGSMTRRRSRSRFSGRSPAARRTVRRPRFGTRIEEGLYLGHGHAAAPRDARDLPQRRGGAQVRVEAGAGVVTARSGRGPAPGVLGAERSTSAATRSAEPSRRRPEVRAARGGGVVAAAAAAEGRGRKSPGGSTAWPMSSEPTTLPSRATRVPFAARGKRTCATAHDRGGVAEAEEEGDRASCGAQRRSWSSSATSPRQAHGDRRRSISLIPTNGATTPPRP